MDYRVSTAGRLGELLRRGKGEPESAPAMEVWARLLGATDRSELHRKFARVLKLPDTVAKQVGLLSGIDHELFLPWYKNVSVAFRDARLEVEWMHFCRGYTGEDIQALGFCAHEMEKQFPETVLDPGELERLGAEIGDLIEELQACGLPGYVNDELLHHLKNAKSAIADYEIWGVESIKGAVRDLFGATVTDAPVFREAQKSGTWWKRFQEVALSLFLMMGVAADTIQIGSAIIPLLPSSASSEPCPEEVPHRENDRPRLDGDSSLDPTQIA